jgi:hypothetical protein
MERASQGYRPVTLHSFKLWLLTGKANCFPTENAREKKREGALFIEVVGIELRYLE